MREVTPENEGSEDEADYAGDKRQDGVDEIHIDYKTVLRACRGAGSAIRMACAALWMRNVRINARQIGTYARPAVQ